MINRLEKLLANISRTRAAFARLVEINPSYLSAVLNGRQPLNDALLMRIVARTGVNEKWLRTGEGEMFESPKSTIEQTPEEFAKSHGCDDFAAGIFARYCRFSDEDKRRFSELLQRLVNNPEAVVGKIGGSSVAINNVFGDNKTHIN